MPGPIAGFGTDIDIDALSRRLALLESRSQDPSNVNIWGGTFAGTDVRKTVIPFRASKSPNVYGNAGIIDRMMADIDLWNIWCFGDSRTNGIIHSKFVGNAPAGIPLGGALPSANTNSVTGFNVAAAGPASGDGLPASPYYGFSPDPFVKYEYQTVAATTAANNTLTNRLLYTSSAFDAGSPVLRARLNARASRARVLVRRSTSTWSASTTSPLNATPTMPNLYLQVRPNGSTATTDPGYSISGALPIYTPDTPEYAVSGASIAAGWDWSTFAPDIGVVCDSGVTIGTAGKIALTSAPWVELPTGILMREVGCVAGRSIAALLNEEVTPIVTFSKAMRACGGQNALWLAIGTNNPKAQTTAQFQSDVMSLIERFRAGAAEAPVVFTTNYAASSDGGANPYYVQALKNIASIDRNVVVLDTYNTLPSYSAGNSLGYYSDVTHYNATGQTAYANAFWSLWNAA